MSKIGNQAALKRKIAAHEAADGKWFTPDTMRFFRSRVETGLLAGDHFVSSEQFVPYDGEPAARRFTVRRFDKSDTFMVETVGEFQEFDTLGDALARVEQITK